MMMTTSTTTTTPLNSHKTEQLTYMQCQMHINHPAVAELLLLLLSVQYSVYNHIIKAQAIYQMQSLLIPIESIYTCCYARRASISLCRSVGRKQLHTSASGSSTKYTNNHSNDSVADELYAIFIRNSNVRAQPFFDNHSMFIQGASLISI